MASDSNHHRSESERNMTGARQRREAHGRSSSARVEPWRARKEWAQNPLRHHNLPEVWVSWGLAIFWNSLLLTIAGPAVPLMVRSHSYVALGVLCLLVACGVGLVLWAVRATRYARRYGQLRLHLDPYPGSIGGHFGATLPLNVPYRTDLQFHVVLRCKSSWEEKGLNNELTLRDADVWQSEGFAHVVPKDRGVELCFRFDLPSGLPPSQRVGEIDYRWSLQIDSHNLDNPFTCTFNVPVFPTGETSAHVLTDATQHPHMPVALQSRMDAVVRLQKIPGGVRLHQPQARRWRQDIQWLLLGGVLVGVGAFARQHGAPWLFPLVFGGVGAAMLAWGLYALCNSVSVRLDQQGLRTERRLLGCMLAWQQVPAALVAKLAVSTDPSIKVEAVLKNGKRVTLSENLPGQQEARHLLATIAASTGYRY